MFSGILMKYSSNSFPFGYLLSNLENVWPLFLQILLFCSLLRRTTARIFNYICPDLCPFFCNFSLCVSVGFYWYISSLTTFSSVISHLLLILFSIFISNITYREYLSLEVWFGAFLFLTCLFLNIRNAITIINVLVY